MAGNRPIEHIIGLKVKLSDDELLQRLDKITLPPDIKSELVDRINTCKKIPDYHFPKLNLVIENFGDGTKLTSEEYGLLIDKQIFAAFKQMSEIIEAKDYTEAIMKADVKIYKVTTCVTGNIIVVSSGLVKSRKIKKLAKDTNKKLFFTPLLATDEMFVICNTDSLFPGYMNYDGRYIGVNPSLVKYCIIQDK